MHNRKLLFSLGVAPVIIITILILTLRVVRPSAAVMEPAMALPVLNTIFLFLIACVISHVAVKSYLISGSSTILLLGGGVFTFGTGSLIAGWAIFPWGPNVTATMHNSAALIASIFHAAGVLADYYEWPPANSPERRRRNLILIYLGVPVAFAALFILCIKGFTPVFFRNETGPTLIRQVFTSIALILFLASSLYLMKRFLSLRSVFLFWYSLALMLIAIGLAGIFIQPTVGSPIGWLARGAQYLAGLYFLVSVRSEVLDARSKGMSLDEAVSALFRTPGLLWRDVIEGIGDAVITIDSSGKILLWNRAAESMFGYSHSQAIGRGLDLIAPEEWKTEFQDLAYSGSKHLEAQLKRSDNSTLSAEISVSSGHLSIGEVTTFIIRNITERKLAQEELQKSEARLRRLYDSGMLGVIYWNIDGEITDANDKFLDMLGYTRKDLESGQVNWIDITPPEYRHQDEKSVLELKQTGINKTPFEKEYIRKDGTRIPILVTGAMLDEKRYDGVAFVLDITVLKNAERALQESEERFRLALRNAPVSVAVQDLDLRYIWSYNQRTAPPEGIVGKTDEDIFTPSEAAHLRAMKTRVLKENIEIHEQMWFDRPAGRIFLDLYWEPIHDEAGRLTGVGSATVNLTPLKEAETNLTELTEQLQEVNKELESFSYSVSHDLRAPLRAIDGFANMLLKDVGDQLDPESMRKFNVIRRNSEKMNQLIEDILKLSRAGRAPVSQSQFDMLYLVKDVWDELQAGNPDRSMELKIKDLPPAAGDRALVRQVVSNLLGNAVKFTRIRDRATIEISGSVADGFNTYCIQDNGAGFDMRHYEKLFGVFHRLHSESEFEGTGIGLAIVKKIIEKHGGRIWAEGKPGEGATFCFTLPAEN